MTSSDISGQTGTRRQIWLDLVRGAALIAMASYHFMWDLADFGYLAPSFPSTGWPKIYARCIASTFLFLAGFSLMLAHGDRLEAEKFFRRFLVIAAAACVVSVATYFAMPQGFIFFGILHAMAAASLVGLIFLRAPAWVTAPAALLAFLAPHYVQGGVFNAPWLWWLGLAEQVKPSFDYVPLLPWLCPFLLGMTAHKLFAVRTALARIDLGKTANQWWITSLRFLGRHSLVFYLVHQPVLMAILYGSSFIIPPPVADPNETYLQGCRPSCEQQQDAAFCKRFCGCTLESLNQQKLLAPFQSGAISMADDPRIKDIAVECSIRSQ